MVFCPDNKNVVNTQSFSISSVLWLQVQVITPSFLKDVPCRNQTQILMLTRKHFTDWLSTWFKAKAISLVRLIIALSDKSSWRQQVSSKAVGPVNTSEQSSTETKDDSSDSVCPHFLLATFWSG